MHCAEYRDLVSAHVDGLLTPEEAALAAAHISDCGACDTLREQQQQFVQALRARAWTRETPATVRQRLLNAIETEEATGHRSGMMRWWEQPRIRIALAGAVAVFMLVVGTFLVRTSRPSADMLATVASDVRAVEAGSLPLGMHTDDPQELRQFYQHTGLFRFFNTVLDLEPLGYILVGGAVGQLGPETSSVTVYRGAHGLIVCHRIAGEGISFPPGGQKVADGTVYTVDGITIWMHRDGDAWCLMASTMPPADLMKLMLGHA